MRFSYNNKVDSKKLDKIVNVLSSPFMNKIFNKSDSDLVSTLETNGLSLSNISFLSGSYFLQVNRMMSFILCYIAKVANSKCRWDILWSLVPA